VVPVVNAPLVLRYSLLRKSSTGSWIPTRADAVFLTGDNIKIEVEASEQAYLYILSRGTSGRWNMGLFPNALINNGNNLVPKRTPYTVPTETGFVFKLPTGPERLFIVLSRTPVKNLDGLKNTLDRGGTNAPQTQLAQNLADSTIAELLKGRDIAFEVEDAIDQGGVFVANRNQGNDDLVFADLTLDHR
jgi:hypothetical protein